MKWKEDIENQKWAIDSTFSLSFHKIWKVVIIKNELVLYYLNGEYTLSHRFVWEELMLIADSKKVRYSSQSILSVHVIYITNKKID